MEPFPTWILDILIHPEKSTSVNSKTSHIDLYVRYNFCAPLPPTPIMNSVKQKPEKPNKLNLTKIQQTTQVNSSLFDQILSLPPYHHQKTQEISRIPRHQSHKLFRNFLTGPSHQNEEHNVIYETSSNDCTATYNVQT